MLLCLVVLVPVAAAAEPWSSDNWATGTWNNDIHDGLITTGTTTIAPDQDLDLLVVLNGTTTVHGAVESVILIGGNADLVGGHVGEIVAIGGRLGLDAGSIVERDIRVVDTDLQQAAGAVIGGRIRRLASSYPAGDQPADGDTAASRVRTASAPRSRTAASPRNANAAWA